jgi:hypothetical protein
MRAECSDSRKPSGSSDAINCGVVVDPIAVVSAHFIEGSWERAVKKRAAVERLGFTENFRPPASVGGLLESTGIPEGLVTDCCK